MVFRGHADEVRSVAFSPFGRQLASTGVDGLKLWDIPIRQAVTQEEFTITTYPVESLAFSPDGSSLATGNDDGTLRLWDMETFRQYKAFKEKRQEASIQAVAFSPDGKMLAIDSSGSAAKVFDVETGENAATPGYKEWPHHVFGLFAGW